ncbi:hypothetical protein AGMMS49944_03540 [Spirochaetia bacterium]|nr:hypothetical protein AGMMS49944_03540 [Spirochaetia bacterium]
MDHLSPVAVGDIEQSGPHGQGGHAAIPAPLKVVEIDLVLHAPDLQGKEILPGNGNNPVPMAGGEDQQQDG